MNRGYEKTKHVERLIQHAIEVFDLVEIVPATRVERSVGRRFRQPEISPATRYAEMGVKRQARKRVLALNSRVC